MAETIAMPKLGFDMAEGTLVRWVKLEGESINKGDVLAEIETDKATVEVESTQTGVVARHLVEAGSSVPVGTPIAIIAAPGETIPTGEIPVKVESETDRQPVKEKLVEKLEENIPLQTTQPEIIVGEIKASPLAKSIAREKGIDLARIHGSGPGGRIVKRDLETLRAVPSPIPPEIPMVTDEDKVTQISRLRAAIGRRMVESKQTIPHFMVTREVNAEPLVILRKQYNESLPEGQKVSVNDFIVKAAALALRQFPNMNASITADTIIQHAHINIGVAVAVEGGLMTVVLRDADVKPLKTLALESVELATRARQGKVKPEDIEGSTFSISNLGMYGVDVFTAIINPPEAAILAVGAARMVPVVKDGKVEPGMVMNLTLSADHRITDGAEAAKFMQVLAGFIEQPWRLVM